MALDAWNPVAPKGLDAESLRAAAMLLPRSDLAHAYALLAFAKPMQVARHAEELRGQRLTEAAQVLRLAGLQVMRQQYLAIMRATKRHDHVAYLFAQLGYHVNHPARHFAPTPASHVDSYYAFDHMEGDPPGTEAVRMPIPAELSQAFGRGVHPVDAIFTTPRHSNNSCFVDTPCALVFLGTKSFDALLLSKDPPMDVRITPAETDVTSTSDEMCTGIDASATPTPRIVLDMRTAVRGIAWGMRGWQESAESYDDRTARVMANIQRFRVRAEKCNSERGAATGQADAFTIYETLLMISGWARWFTAPIVTLTVQAEIDNTRLQPPEIVTMSVGSPRDSARLKLIAPETTDAQEFILQDLVRYALGARIAETADIHATQWSAVRKLLRSGDASRVAAATRMLKEAHQIFAESAKAELGTLWGLWFSMDAQIPSIAGTQPDTNDVDAIVAAHKYSAAKVDTDLPILYAQTKAASRRYSAARELADGRITTWRKSARVKSWHGFNVRISALTTARRANDARLIKAAISATTERIQYMPVMPSAGVFVLDANVFRMDHETRVERRIRITPTAGQAARTGRHPFSVMIPVGPPGSQEDVAFTIYAVMVHSGDASGGHYWGYFWRGDTLYRYNDTHPVPTERVASGPDTDHAIDMMETIGVYYMIERDV